MAAAVVLALGACDKGPPATGQDDLKRTMDQLVGLEKDELAAAKETAGAARSAAAEIRTLTERVDALAKSTSTLLVGQKRAAIFLPLEVETACDDDALCNSTARGVCNKINYPHGIPSKFTNGSPPKLNSVVCFD